jgi:micrococcal nuclease
MRLHLLLLLLIPGLSPNVGYAGTLVGDWYQEEMENSPNFERRAFSQPISQSTEANQITLGIKSPGLMDPVDFYAVISSKSTDVNCQYVVREIIVDAEIFTIGSNDHSSDITQLLTKTDDEQAKLWRAFKKGQNLSLKIHQTCSSDNAQIDEVNTFTFSLTGSSAAYRFVTRQEAIVIRKQESKEITESGDATGSEDVSGDVGTTSEAEFSYQILYFLAFGLFIFVLIKMPGQRHKIPDALDSSLGTDSRKPATGINGNSKPGVLDFSRRQGRGRPTTRAGDYIKPEDTLETATHDIPTTAKTGDSPGSEKTPDIANFPKFKVEYVVDGDTVKVTTSWQKITIRLDSIDCPEDGQEWGDKATWGLIKMIGGKYVHVEEHATDHYGRTVATLYVYSDEDSKWLNVNEKMVARGHAWVMRRYYKHLPKHRQTKLNDLERWAKSKPVGLWKLPDPIPPWKWRQES